MASTSTVKLRRSKSVYKIEAQKSEERKQKIWRHDIPIHRHADSFFSTSSGFTNYRGLLNLCLILLVLSNARLVLENVIKYGILVNPIDWLQLFLQQPDSWPNLLLVLSVNVFILLAYSFEILFTKKFNTVLAVESYLPWRYTRHSLADFMV